jgi:hypothetical protein
MSRSGCRCVVVHVVEIGGSLLTEEKENNTVFVVSP